MKLFTILTLTLASLTTAIPAATTSPAHDVAPTFPVPNTSPPGNDCGTCILTGSGYARDLRTSVPASMCHTLDEGENYGSCSNRYCGICIMFKEDNCMGDITYWGGPGAGPFNAKAARSYFCM